MFERITIDPNVCHGQPVIKGTRVLVSNVLSFLASGMSVEEVISQYPNIKKNDVLEAISFSSSLSKFETHSYDIKAS